MPLWLHTALNVTFILGCVAAPVGVIVALVQQKPTEPRRNSGKSGDLNILALFAVTILSASSFWSGIGAPWVPAAVAIVSLRALQGAHPNWEFHIAFGTFGLAGIGAAVHLITPI